MSEIKVYSASIVGINAAPVEVEVDLGKGLPALIIVGLPDKAVEEARERVRSALKRVSGGLPNRRIVVNLAPAQFKKEGSHFDLAISLAILLADGYIRREAFSIVNDSLFVGELGLDGGVRPIKGALAFAETAKALGVKNLFLPAKNASEGALISSLKVFGLENLQELVDYLNGSKKLMRAKTNINLEKRRVYGEAFLEIRGQALAKRAAIIAVAGKHHLFLLGPPGVGKTMLAKAISELLPSLSLEEALEVTKIHSLAGEFSGREPLLIRPPFRTPHHTISKIALIGGGSHPKPGEITLAHRGVLFLDELPEFERSTLEVLRQPLEEGKVWISRAEEKELFPADFLMIGAANPCPCGFFGDPQRECRCTFRERLKYFKRLSGPLLDRIDLFVYMQRPEGGEVLADRELASIEKVFELIERARERQLKRQNKLNSQLKPSEIKKLKIEERAVNYFREIINKFSLSPRAIHRLLKVSQTIADIEESRIILRSHLLEALQLRQIESLDI